MMTISKSGTLVTTKKGEGDVTTHKITTDVFSAVTTSNLRLFCPVSQTQVSTANILTEQTGIFQSLLEPKNLQKKLL
jgi:hypothetical protein